MTRWKEVSETEMRNFIASYPKELHFDTCFIVEPPTATFSEVIGDRTVPVARYYDDYLDGNRRHCFIRADINEEDAK